MVRPVSVSTVTIPPFCAPASVTGPRAVGSWLLPVSPSLLLSWVELGVESLPEPPHALSVSAPAVATTTIVVLARMSSPFDRCRPSGVSRDAEPDIGPDSRKPSSVSVSSRRCHDWGAPAPGFGGRRIRRCAHSAEVWEGEGLHPVCGALCPPVGIRGCAGLRPKLACRPNLGLLRGASRLPGPSHD